jgi:DNA polymerase
LVRQVIACRPWLEAEIAALAPKLIVCMGSTAAQSVLSRTVRILHERGKFLAFEKKPLVFVTIHPSAIYRQRDRSEQENEYRRFAEEMKLVSRKLRSLKTE